MERICAEARARYPEQVANLIETWFWSGLRTSEIIGLRWRNVFLNRDEIVVREAVVRGVRKGTKTNLIRVVALNSRSHKALEQQRRHIQKGSDCVFFDPRFDKPWTVERAFRRVYWIPLLKSLKIRYRRQYNMRHTYATVMFMAGMTPAYCAKQLGHSVQIFLTKYAVWIDGAQDQVEKERLESAITAITGTG